MILVIRVIIRILLTPLDLKEYLITKYFDGDGCICGVYIDILIATTIEPSTIELQT